MSTGKRNKQRSYEHEMEIVRLAQSMGLGAKRAWASNGRAAGWPETVDVCVYSEREEVRIQAKRRVKIADYITPPEGADITVIREDRGKNYAVVPLEMFFEWLFNRQE